MNYITNQEYEYAVDFAKSINPAIVVPPLKELERGAIIGIAEIVGCASESESPWFVGDYGFVLANAYPIDPIPLKGQLGFFNPRIEV